MVKLKRAYEDPARSDGRRILVDRLWPRGLSKERAQLDDWMKDLAPSDELRKWFGHDPEKWDEFRKRYFRELASKPGTVAKPAEKVQEGPVTLVYSAKNKEHNNALALKEYIEKRE